MEKHVFSFGGSKTEGDMTMRDTLGGKGANLAEMAGAGIPVPPGFTVSTQACNLYLAGGNKIPESVEVEMAQALARLESDMGKKLGDPNDPLLVSVRSGAKFSMPGMMDTVLNLGLNDVSVAGLAKVSGNWRFALDCYRRFIMMFGDVVMGVSKSQFERILEGILEEAGVESDTELNVEQMQGCVDAFKEHYQRSLGEAFPEDPIEQLKLSRDAVFRSWDNPRARHYRRMNDIANDLGTAVNVQVMVYGNLGETSATGVGFTRDPATGDNTFYGEFLLNAQGEDVVAGIRTPRPISELKGILPEAYEELRTITARLERHYRDVQDFEFTVQQSKLYMLQTRSGKRTGAAAVKFAVDMVDEGLITDREAVMRVEPQHLDQLLHPVIEPSSKSSLTVLTKGLPASPGAAVGQIVFTADSAVEEAALGNDVLLVRGETTPEDIHGMEAAKGILTSRGGMTSHAAVVARGMGSPCVAGAGEVTVDADSARISCNGHELKAGDWISIDGSTGEVFVGQAATIDPDPKSGTFARFMEFVDKHRVARVRANAETPRDARAARSFGAEGIGLCRTEHMFFEPDRIGHVRQMILAKDDETRAAALSKLLPMQRQDFVDLFEVMDGYPVIVRTLDPPLHEFLPKREDLMVELAQLRAADGRADSGSNSGTEAKLAEVSNLLERVEELHEFNPMLGHRGCRLGITFPEITEMQARAIFEAAVECAARGVDAIPEVMIPLVGTFKELVHQKRIVVETAERVFQETGKSVHYKVGTMIEVPRGALTADQIAHHAEFFSFGTNDLTQTTYGFSRDDSGPFISAYRDQGIFEEDPFQVLDSGGVGQLIEIAVEKGRAVRPNLEIGICGEHGGEPKSVTFCVRSGLDYVSCSPYRVPIARLAAAQTAITG